MQRMMSTTGATPSARANLLLLAVSALAIAVGCVGAAQATPQLKVLFSFTNLKGDEPAENLIADAAGNLYGMTVEGGADNDGAVFELSPPAAGKRAWKQTVLNSFNGADGELPVAGLIADAAGNLYGTAQAGGFYGGGVLFELSPPPAGKKAWVQTVLNSFTGIKGQTPLDSLMADAAGNLYGTTLNGGISGYGAAFELSPPAAGKKNWKENVLQSFGGTKGQNPRGGLIADGAGNLYGTTLYGGPHLDGVVYELSPPAAGLTAWTETVLFSFNGTNGENPIGLIADGVGNLYGAATAGGPNGDGDIYELSPPAAGQTAWTQTVICAFDGKNGESPLGLIADGAGNLYGTAQLGGRNNDGVVFELSPPPAGKKAWTETVLQSFKETDGQYPLGTLFADGAGNLYGTTLAGGAYSQGVVFELTP